ncbi:SH3 domain-containing protein [Guyparkeria sp.]|uniref:SH3 domain-containing protein n=1 Tax=Guyparkeria sp. TaxID=2035736 RepID=UPI0039706E86
MICVFCKHCVVSYSLFWGFGVKGPFLLFVILCSSAVMADYDSGLAEFDRGNYASAVHEWRMSAEKGDPQSQFALGSVFEKGKGVSIDLEKAHKWYRLSADNGLLEAQVRLGELYMANLLSGGPGEAVRWFEMAARRGHASSQFMLGLLYLEGEAVKKNVRVAARWFEAAAEQGHAAAANNIGGLYEEGRGVDQSFERAFHYYETAARQGDPKSQNNLGALYALGRGVEQNHAWAVFWFAMAEKNGDEVAKENIKKSLSKLESGEIAVSHANVRAGIGTDHEVISVLEKGARLWVLGGVDGWSQVYYEQSGAGYLGWISSSLID